VLVTSEPASWNGKYLIVNTAADGTGAAMNGTGTANVTSSGGKILSTSTIDGYALTVTSAGEVHPNQTSSSQELIAYDIKFSDGNWLYWYSNKYKQTSEDQSSRHNKCTLFYDNGGVRLMSAGYNVNLNGDPLSTTPSKNYLYYSSNKFTMSSSQASSRVQLYKLDDGGTTPGGGNDPTPTTATYTKVNSVSSGATYLIVSHNDALAFKGDGTTNGPYTAVAPADGVISASSTALKEYEAIITEESAGQYSIYFTNLKQYLYYQNSSSGLAWSAQHDSSNDFSLTILNSGENAGSFVFTKSEKYLYYNGTQFKIGGSGANIGVHLYQKTENP